MAVSYCLANYQWLYVQGYVHFSISSVILVHCHKALRTFKSCI